MTIEAREIARELLYDLRNGKLKAVGIDQIRERIRAHKHYSRWSRSNVEFLEQKVCRLIVQESA